MHNAQGLQRSRWAPSSIVKSSITTSLSGTSKTSAERRLNVQRQSYQRFLKSFRRLKWKSTTLLFCYERALSRQTDNVIHGLNFPITSDTNKANAAEIMFKVDWFEFYALLERVLVYLLESVGMVVSADHTASSVPLPREVHTFRPEDDHDANVSIIGNSNAFTGYSHRFHANVLAALDAPSNPLHHTLGRGKVRQYLSIAKEFRNLWKEVEDETETQDQLSGIHKSYHQIVTELNLSEMLATILGALEASGPIAAQHLTSMGLVEVDMLTLDEKDTCDELVNGDAMEWD